MLVTGRVLRVVDADKKYSNRRESDPITVIAEDGYHHWDYTNCFNALSVMSVPSPNGSTSSVFSSEDSSSTASSSLHSSSSHYHLQQHLNHLQPSVSGSLPNQSQPSILPSSLSSGGSKQLKLCGVCGDHAKSYHFGGISCDSCKAFFRRSVQNDAYCNFHCPYEGHCDINISSRKCCQYCRFYKCLSIGMEKGWVMTEEERLLMLKNRIERKKQLESDDSNTQTKRSLKHNLYQPDINEINHFLSDHEVKMIENLMNLYAVSVKEISFSEQLTNKSRDRSKVNMSCTEILDIFFTAVQQFSLFAQRLASLTDITDYDQSCLIKEGIMELCFIRGAFLYNTHTNCWPLTDSESLSSSSMHTEQSMFITYLQSDDLKPIISENLLENHLNFIKSLKRLHIDEATSMILTAIVLLTPDRSDLNDSNLIQIEQEKYLLLLKRYMNWRYGNRASLLYPKLLLKLTDLRELAEAHTDCYLLLCKDEKREIQKRLSTLNIGSDESIPNNNESLDYSSMASAKSNIPSSAWTIDRCLPPKNNQKLTCDSDKVYDELSTSSEGSDEKLVSSD